MAMCQTTTPFSLICTGLCGKTSGGTIPQNKPHQIHPQLNESPSILSFQQKRPLPGYYLLLGFISYVLFACECNVTKTNSYTHFNVIGKFTSLYPCILVSLYPCILSTVFHFTSSPDNSPLSHSVLLVFLCLTDPFNYVSLNESLPQP